MYVRLSAVDLDHACGLETIIQSELQPSHLMFFREIRTNVEDLQSGLRLLVPFVFKQEFQTYVH